MLSTFYLFRHLALEIPENPSTKLSPTSPSATCFVTNSRSSSSTTPSSSTTCTTVFASVLAPSTTQSQSQSPSPSTSSFSNLMSNLARSDNPNNGIIMGEPTSLSLSTPLYLSNNIDPLHYTAASPQPALSATALLQKAAQMGASNASILRGLGEGVNINATTTLQWNGQVKQENHIPEVDNLGLGLLCGSGGVPDVMMGQPMTRDLLGLSIGTGGASRGSLSALLNTFGGGNFDSSGNGGAHR